MDVKGPKQHLACEAEEEQQRAGRQCHQIPDPPPGQLEEQAHGGAEGGNVDYHECRVVRAGDSEGRFVDQLATELQVAVVGGEQIFEAERVELDDVPDF